MKVCPYCNENIQGNHYAYANHVRWCKDNPKYKEIKESTIEKNSIKQNKKHIFNLNCVVCGSEYSIYTTDYKYSIGKYKKTCCIGCSKKLAVLNTNKGEKNDKIKNGVRRFFIEKGYLPDNKIINSSYHKIIVKICENCGKEFEILNKYKNRKYCCKECMKQSRFKKLSISGKKSTSMQQNERRSKNEKLFCDLCEQYFDKVGHNEPIFNGWDADVLIYDLKIAILWNGVWHYKKITKQHSVELVQNRDKIKINEIKQSGWIPYIIKDEGKYNPSFVQEKFNEFIKIYNTGVSPQAYTL